MFSPRYHSLGEIGCVSFVVLGLFPSLSCAQFMAGAFLLLDMARSSLVISFLAAGLGAVVGSSSWCDSCMVLFGTRGPCSSYPV
jgi:hypothetical protein